MSQLLLHTGARYSVRVDADGALKLDFTAVLEAIEFEASGNFSALVFDNGVRLWPWDLATFDLEEVPQR